MSDLRKDVELVISKLPGILCDCGNMMMIAEHLLKLCEPEEMEEMK